MGVACRGGDGNNLGNSRGKGVGKNTLDATFKTIKGEMAVGINHEQQKAYAGVESSVWRTWLQPMGSRKT